MDRARCPFEKTLTSAQCTCEMAQRYAIAERIGVQCRSSLAAANCRTLLGLVREQARFALKVTDTSRNLPFGKELQVMLGTARGLEQLVGSPGKAGTAVQNIHHLVQLAQQRFGSLTALPIGEILQAVAVCKPRRRRS